MFKTKNERKAGLYLILIVLVAILAATAALVPWINGISPANASTTNTDPATFLRTNG